ncbi:MAG: signal peptide peptidase SppA [Desulfobacterales bacterium]|jgi:protease-4|nr:signal peptide peptidase SppA [Desulfobacterales bacterium]
MFSRRHPFLFFLLALTALVGGTLVCVALLFTLGRGISRLDFGQKVGVIEVSGAITEAEETLERLKQFREDDTVRAIVIRINSPGGGVGPSQEIYSEIRKTIPTKKVIASLGSVAASGGYYLAAATNGIVANPGTITGSIGVILGYTDLQEVFRKIGLAPVVVKSGAFKDMGSPLRAMSTEEQAILQGFVDKIHQQFVQAVAQGRNMDIAVVAQLADGRIYTGEEALGLGLVDRLGNLTDAIEWAGHLGGIEGDPKVVYAREKTGSFLKYFLESTVKAVMEQVTTSVPGGGYLLHTR